MQIVKDYSLHNDKKELPKLKDCLLLDSTSSLDLLGNKKFCKNIRKMEKPIGVGTNGGDLMVKNEANMFGYGDVNFDENAIANILALRNMVKKFRVQFDSKYANCFFVHTPSGILKFECDKRGMYSYVPGPAREPTKEEKIVATIMEDDMKNTVTSKTFVQTVEKNMKGFTNNQQLRAKEARKAYHILFAPSMRSLKEVECDFTRQQEFDFVGEKWSEKCWKKESSTEFTIFLYNGSDRKRKY